MRSLVLLSVVVGLGSCQNAVDDDCKVAADCGPGFVCVEGACIVDDRPVPLPPGGEGEGEKPGEGEGEGVVGEGEGEGGNDLAGEGEGEGGSDLAGEGEGEGATDLAGEGEGEGEGEGDADPCAGVVCGEFQACSDGACEFIGEMCDAFQGFSVGAFVDSDQELNVLSGTNLYEKFFTAQLDGTHLLDAYDMNIDTIDDVVTLIRADTTSRPSIGQQIDLTTTQGAYDTFLGVVDDGTCTEVVSNDDLSGDLRHSRVQLDAAQMARVNNVLVVTSRNRDVSSDVRPYNLRVRPLLCGVEVDSVATFNNCGRALSTTANTCANNNPCERNASGGLTGRACCISTSAATATQANACGRRSADPITTFASAACN